MKKNKTPSAVAQDRTPSGGKDLQDGHRSRSDSGSSTPRKLSASEKDKPGKALSKNFLSKSQDNLASQLRRKAVAAALSQKEAASNKENLTFKTPSTPKGKPPKSAGGGTPGPKAQNSQNTDTTGSPMKRAQSAQNITKTPKTPQNTENSVKRASSTQNISREKGTRQVRISAPVNIMAYNAELLASFEKEKKILERRISELIQVAEGRKTEIEKFKFEVKNLKEKIPPKNVGDEWDIIRSENSLLKDRLQELGVSVEHITDTEKLALKKEKASSPSSESSFDARGGAGDEDVSLIGHGSHRTDGDGVGGDLATLDSELGLSVGDLSCITPEHPSSLSLDNSNWDKQSNKSSDAMSEVSVTFLQDRILQMEETHYSTNEELQATLQELGDLQDMVNDLTAENERLIDERSILLESLCAQTEKLENCRMQIEHLKALLVSESEGGDRSENERQLVALLKSAQEEREEFMLKQIELSNALHHMENEIRELQDIITALRDKAHILDMKNESLLADKRSLEAQVSELKETTAKDAIELQRYKTLYENEKTKVDELEQCRKAIDKTDLEELLDNTRQEKDKVEAKLTNTTEELAVTLNELGKMKEHTASLEEEIKVCKNNAKTQVSDLEYRMEQVNREKTEMQNEMETLRDHIDQLQLDCDRYLEEKKSHSSTLTDLQTELKTTKQKMIEMENRVSEQEERFKMEKDDWSQFQQDLQTAVVIANEFKMETQEDMDNIIKENETLKNQNTLFKEELERLAKELDKVQKQKTEISKSELKNRVINTMDRDLLALRGGRKLSDPFGNQSLSVKNLIASIEQQVKTGTPPLSPVIASQCSSRRNSTDSTISVNSIKVESPTKTGVDRRSSMPAEMKSLKRQPDQKEGQRAPISHRHTITNIIYDTAPPVMEDTKVTPPGRSADTPDNGKKTLTGILTNKSSRKNSTIDDGSKQDKSPHTVHGGIHGVKSDPLSNLAKQMGGSKRNALLKWCQNKTSSYSGIDITNFSSSWNDGLAFCAIMHNYLPDKVPYKELNSQDQMRNFALAFKAAESVGIPSILNTTDMVAMERPDWQAVMTYVTSIYKHFEVDSKL